MNFNKPFQVMIVSEFLAIIRGNYKLNCLFSMEQYVYVPRTKLDMEITPSFTTLQDKCLDYKR